MMNKNIIAEEYDYLGDVVYLNVCRIAMPPRRVQRAFERHMRGYVETVGMNYPKYFDDILKNARERVADLLDCLSSEIGFVRSTSDSMTILANSFPFNTGDNVVLTTEEHASNVVPWLALERKGVEVRFAESHDGCVYIDDFIAKMDNRTKIVSTSSVYPCNGFAPDLPALAAECKKRDIVFAVDAIQSLGRLALRPHEIGINFIGCGSHKGLLGTKGAGILFCDSNLLQRLSPYTGSQQGILNNGRPFPLRHYNEIEWNRTAKRFESGNYTYSVIESVSEGVSLINSLGIDEIEKYIRSLEDIFYDAVSSLPLKVTKHQICNRSGMIAVYYPDAISSGTVEKILESYNIRATVRPGYVRFAFHLYNNEKDVLRMSYALADIAKL